LGILGEGDEDEQMAHVCEKRKGKRLTEEEPSLKKKSTGASWHEERPVTISAAASRRRWQMIVTSLLDNDGIEVCSNGRAITSPATALGGMEMCRMWRSRVAAMTAQQGA
jgi:hypothetical protein